MKYSWQVQEFDTNHFGFKIGKINFIDSKESEKDILKQISSVIQEIKDKKVKYVTYRFSADNITLIHALEKSGFILVDGLVELQLELSNDNLNGKFWENVREANYKDIKALKQLASRVFSYNRFYNDPFIDKKKADELYAKWVGNSVLGITADSVLIWEEDKRVKGFVTLEKKGHIPLIGLDSKLRGKGIGKKMLESALVKFKEWGVKNVKIETQIINISTLRTAQNGGFKITNSYLTYRWLNEEI